MLRCLLMWIALGAMGLIILASPTSTILAAVCSPPGEVVVTDPSGDGPTPETDVLDIAIQEVVAGPNAGKIIVTLHVSSLGSTPSGLWVVGWEDGTGNNSTQFAMSACNGVPTFSYTYDTPENTESGAPDGGSYTAGGTIEWIIAREKIGSPANGELFVQIQAFANVWVPLDPLPGCLPQGGADTTAPGQYVVGNCLVDAPVDRPAIALRLGAPTPNPARGDVSFALEVPGELAGRSFEAALFDASGRRLRTIASGAVTPGRTALRWDLRDASEQRVRAGAYWARITVGGERRTQVFVVR